MDEDGVTVNGLLNTRAARGSIISIYATGEGQTQPGGIDGRIAAGSAPPKPALPVTVLIDGKAAEVQYAGAAPGAVAGLFQVNVRIPADATPGAAALEIPRRQRDQPGRYDGRGEIKPKLFSDIRR